MRTAAGSHRDGRFVPKPTTWRDLVLCRLITHRRNVIPGVCMYCTSCSIIHLAYDVDLCERASGKVLTRSCVALSHTCVLLYRYASSFLVPTAVILSNILRMFCLTCVSGL